MSKRIENPLKHRNFEAIISIITSYPQAQDEIDIIASKNRFFIGFFYVSTYKISSMSNCV